jgi:hypothetical protein
VGPTRWRAETFTSITWAASAASNLPGHGAEQEASHARSDGAAPHDQTATGTSTIFTTRATCLRPTSAPSLDRSGGSSWKDRSFGRSSWRELRCLVRRRSRIGFADRPEDTTVKCALGPDEIGAVDTNAVRQFYSSDRCLPTVQSGNLYYSCGWRPAVHVHEFFLWPSLRACDLSTPCTTNDIGCSGFRAASRRGSPTGTRTDSDSHSCKRCCQRCTALTAGARGNNFAGMATLAGHRSRSQPTSCPRCLPTGQKKIPRSSLKLAPGPELHYRLSIARGNRDSQIVGPGDPSLPLQLAVALEIADTTAGPDPNDPACRRCD